MKDKGNGFVKDGTLESIYTDEPIYDTDSAYPFTVTADSSRPDPTGRSGEKEFQLPEIKSGGDKGL